LKTATDPAEFFGEVTPSVDHQRQNPSRIQFNGGTGALNGLDQNESSTGN
jgi:hypothetical protein